MGKVYSNLTPMRQRLPLDTHVLIRLGVDIGIELTTTTTYPLDKHRDPQVLEGFRELDTSHPLRGDGHRGDGEIGQASHQLPNNAARGGSICPSLVGAG